MQATVVTYAQSGIDFHSLSRRVSKVVRSETAGIERAGNSRAKLRGEAFFSRDAQTGHCGGSSPAQPPRERRRLRGRERAGNAIYFGVIKR